MRRTTLRARRARPAEGASPDIYSHTVPAALSVEVSDPLGLRGIQADLKTFSSLGVHGASAITGLLMSPAPDGAGAVDVPPAQVIRQMEAVFDSTDDLILKAGDVRSPETISALARFVEQRRFERLVLDPVLVDESGERRSAEYVSRLRQEMLPLALVATPSVEEAEMLLGGHLKTWDMVREAAVHLHAKGCANVIITGSGKEGSSAVDLLYDGQDFREFTAERVASAPLRGAGAAFASALAATLAKGDNVATAAAAAKAYVTRALQQSFVLGSAGPVVHHFYRYWRPQIKPPTQ